jgi:hypothetical protein
MLLFLAGCGSSTGDTATRASTTQNPNTVITPNTWPVKVPQSVASRTPLPDCGMYVYEGDEGDHSPVDCFWTAYNAGQPAEVRILFPGWDTPPTAMYYRTVERGKNEVIYLGSDLASPTTGNCYELVRRAHEQIDCSLRPSATE